MSSETENRIYLNALNQIQQIGPVRFQKLLNHFGDPKAAWQANPKGLLQAGLEETVVNKLLELRQTFDPESEYNKLRDQNIALLTVLDPDYPPLLKEITSPPSILYIRGELQPKDNMAVAVVGTRKISTYGRQVALELVRDLVRANITVISGLALGVDAAAHRAVLEFEGRTIAVLGCGIDSIYPVSNRALGEAIIQRNSGALISELPLGAPPLKHHFPNRNRIIAGLTLGTIVIEAAEESGALITARHALEQNRQVFAVPGSIFSQTSKGPNNLLKMGARLVTSAADVLDDLNLGTMQEQLVAEEIIGDNEEESLILSFLSKQPTHADEITKQSKLPASTVAATLTMMEMKGKIRNLGANQYILGR